MVQPFMGWVGYGEVGINNYCDRSPVSSPVTVLSTVANYNKEITITKTLHYKIINLQYAVKPLVSNDPNAKTFWLHTHCTRGAY